MEERKDVKANAKAKVKDAKADAKAVAAEKEEEEARAVVDVVAADKKINILYTNNINLFYIIK